MNGVKTSCCIEEISFRLDFLPVCVLFAESQSRTTEIQ